MVDNNIYLVKQPARLDVTADLCFFFVHMDTIALFPLLLTNNEKVVWQSAKTVNAASCPK